MNGRLGKFVLQPDQMQALNPILILVFIPIFETIIYPIFGKCNLLKKYGSLFFSFFNRSSVQVRTAKPKSSAVDKCQMMFYGLCKSKPINVEWLFNGGRGHCATLPLVTYFPEYMYNIILMLCI